MSDKEAQRRKREFEAAAKAVEYTHRRLRQFAAIARKHQWGGVYVFDVRDLVWSVEKRWRMRGRKELVEAVVSEVVETTPGITRNCWAAQVPKRHHVGNHGYHFVLDERAYSDWRKNR